MVLQVFVRATQLALRQLPRRRSAVLVEPRVLGTHREADRELETAREAAVQLRRYEAGHLGLVLLEVAEGVWCCRPSAVFVRAPS